MAKLNKTFKLSKRKSEAQASNVVTLKKPNKPNQKQSNQKCPTSPNLGNGNQVLHRGKNTLKHTPSPLE